MLMPFFVWGNIRKRVGIMLISGYKISFAYSEKVILKETNFVIKEYDRIGIIGPNGAGKTTLVEIIAGYQKCDSGKLEKGRQNLQVSYLKQVTKKGEYDDVFTDNQASAFLSDTKKLNLDTVTKWSDVRFENLSGGERTKVELAKVFNERGQLLILDEPTNNLDQKGIMWLIEQIQRYKGAVIVISHDRYFLDQVVNKVFAIEKQKIHQYDGTYSDYQKEKARRNKAYVNQYEKEKKEQQKIDLQIAKLREWSDKAHRQAGKGGTLSENRQAGLKEFERVKAKKRDKQVKSREKRLLKLKTEGLEKLENDNDVVLISKKVGEKMGKVVLEVDSVTKRFHDKILFSDVSFYIKRGEKIGVIGDNGVGKSTLIRCLLNQEKVDRGNIFMSPSQKVGYLSQDILDFDDTKTIMQLLKKDQMINQSEARMALAQIGLTNEYINKKIGTLSFGEKMRLKLVLLLLVQSTFLILDEPTNHLDIESREQLEKMLKAYTGTIFIVSHDRYLIENVCDKTLVFEKGTIKRFESGMQNIKLIQKSEETGISESDKMLIEFQITKLLSELSQLDVESKLYQEVQNKLERLYQKKREL